MKSLGQRTSKLVGSIPNPIDPKYFELGSSVGKTHCQHEGTIHQ